ncbi:MAG: hypothetical protein E6I25_05225 [Chloroflexi bacterium]|nr:MAG: hypothetical protein E6I25_05225 [Chloroflexota bacterium]
MTGDEPDNPHGFVPVSFQDGRWTTAEGKEVPWYEVQTDLVPEADVQGALERVLSVYGVSDVVVDAFDQFRKELKQPADASRPDGDS